MKRLLLRMTIPAVAAALLSLPVAERSDAADYQFRPSIRLGQGFDSNVFNTTSNEVSDFYFTATPELLLSAATPQASLQLIGGMEGRWYYDNPDISSWDYSEYVRLSSGWKATERFTLTPAAYYLRSSDQYQRYLLAPTDPSIPTPPIATYGLQKVTNFGASMGASYLAIQDLETGGSAYYAAQDYPGQVTGSSDSRQYGLTATLRYLFSPRSSLGAYVSANGTAYEATPDSQVLAVGIFGGYQFSPAWKFDGRIGISFAHLDASATVPSQSTQDPAGTITLGYTDNTFQANLYANVGYSGLGGDGQLTRQGTAGITFSDRVTEGWSWNLGGYYQINRTVFAATNTDSFTLNGSASIRYAPWNWGSFDLTGYGTRQWSDLPGRDLKRYSAILGFTLGELYTAY